MLFSVIIPTYKRRDTLRIALQSLSSQTIDRGCFAVVVVNNFAAIGVNDIVQEYSESIKITSLTEPECGAHKARNLGSKAARGDYLVFIDDDCEAHPSLLEDYRSAIEQHRPIVAGGRIEIKWDHEPPSWVRSFEEMMGKLDLGTGCFWLPEGQVVYGGNLLVRRDFFHRIGGMEPDQFGRIILGSGDVGLSLSANRYGYKVLWVGDAGVWHLQKKRVNGRLYDLMRREFNDGVMAAFELQKKDRRLVTLGLGPLSARLFVSAIRQLFLGSLRRNRHSLANACFALSKLVGLHWFHFYKNRTVV